MANIHNMRLIHFVLNRSIPTFARKMMNYMMMTLVEKFNALKADNAPGQEVRQSPGDLSSIMLGEKIDGIFVDFSHGDVDTFAPAPGSEEVWNAGFREGARQAYTEYRGAAKIRMGLAERLGNYTGKSISAENELIITPGTQGALFLALGATVTFGTKVAVVIPDYFANRKLALFFGGEIVPIPLNYKDSHAEKGIDLKQLELAFKNGVTQRIPSWHCIWYTKID